MNKEELKEIKKHIKEYPTIWQEVILKIYGSYPKECLPNGMCDYGYIINSIAHALGLGNGRGKFYKFEVLK